MRRIVWDKRLCSLLIGFFLTVFVVESLAQEKEWQTSNRPNIVILITHDTGQHFGCYGIKTVHSPNIDRLARQGVLLKEFFCTAPQCSPSRSSLYTGRFPHANGVMSVIQQEFEWDLHPGERHLAGFLKEAGYRTARIGGGHETRRPEEMGFTDIISVPAPRTCEEAAKVSSKFFQETAKDDRPFYVQVYFLETHRGFSFGGAKPDSSKGVYIPPYIIDEPSARKDFAEFQGAIRKMDASIGTILKALEDTGLSENTIVIYTVDHGIPFPRAKMTPYDAGIEVACIVRWPMGGWTGGKVYDHMISNVDVLPTILDLLDIPVPKNVHGRSFLGLLNGTDYTPRDVLYAESYGWGDPRRCIRTKTHKLIANFRPGTSFKNCTGTWRPLSQSKIGNCKSRHPWIELYDLVKDPLESKNVVGNPEYEPLQKELMKRLLKWMEETDDPLLERVPMPPMHKKTLQKLRDAARN